MFNGKDLTGWKISNFGGEGEVEVKNGEIRLDYGNPISGITWTGAELPKDHYAIELEAMRLDGIDFFVGLTFPVRDQFCSLILGGWAGTVSGLSSFDYQDAANNETTYVVEYKKNRWYKVRMEVAGELLRAYVDGKKIIETEINGRQVHIRPEVEPSKPLGISSFETQVAYRNIRIFSLR
ncbi:MAG: DUF1080 domain-containing protein [Lentisphaerales bacterium]|nr:DUF1080 domain-containing protein [Lentisphaerales bacterium]